MYYQMPFSMNRQISIISHGFQSIRAFPKDFVCITDARNISSIEIYDYLHNSGITEIH